MVVIIECFDVNENDFVELRKLTIKRRKGRVVGVEFFCKRVWF